MQKYLLETPFTQLLVEAITGEVPKVQSGVDTSILGKYDQEVVCILPESLRGMHELRVELCALGENLESELASFQKGSQAYLKLVSHLDTIKLQVEALGNIIFSELFKQYPELCQNGIMAFTREWQVLRLTRRKKNSVPKQKDNTHHIH